MKRRTLIGGMAGGALAGLSGNIIRTGGHAGERSREPMVKAGDIPMRTFGKTGVKLTIIGLASGRFHLTGSDEDAIALTRRAVALGVKYFDTAHTYWNGHSEEIYGRALPEFRKQIFIATKSNKRDRKGAEEDLNTSLKSMKARFTGHHDPDVHLEMLRRYDKWDTILMPLHIADPLYLSFERQVLPIAVKRGMGIQGMKNFGNAKLLQTFSVRECLSYVLSLPIHCTAIGCTTIGQLEDDVRVAQSFKPIGEQQMASLRQRAERIKGPLLEDWKKNTEPKISLLQRPEYQGG